MHEHDPQRGDGDSDTGVEVLARSVSGALPTSGVTSGRNQYRSLTCPDPQPCTVIDLYAGERMRGDLTSQTGPAPPVRGRSWFNFSRPGPFAHQDSPRMLSIGRSRHRQWRRLPINGSSFSAARVLLCPLPIGESVLECVILDVVDGVADRPGGDNPVAEP